MIYTHMISKIQSEHDVAFVGDGRDRITRGQNFHDEALRLWVLEESRPILTNIQALCILSLEWVTLYLFTHPDRLR